MTKRGASTRKEPNPVTPRRNDRGRLDTQPHVLKAVLHNLEHPDETPHGRNRKERRAIAAQIRKALRMAKKAAKKGIR